MSGTIALSAACRGGSDGPVLVGLLYHRFVSPEAYASLTGNQRIYSIGVDRFERQLACLRDRGYYAASLEEALAFAQGQRNLPARSVLITIDDGCRSALTRAGPLLQRYGMRATLFVTVDPEAYVFGGDDDQRRLTDDELRSLDPAVFEVGAHGVTHRALRELPDAELARELTEARELLEKVVGHPVRAMAAPRNRYTPRVQHTAREAGYEAMFTSDRGFIRHGDDLFALRRWNVAGYWSMKKIEAILDGRAAFHSRARVSDP